MQRTGVHKQVAKNKPDKNRQTYAQNDSLILKTIESEPGLRNVQISARTGLGRRIVRKHLWNLQARGKVAKVGAGYFLAGGSSGELNELFRKAIRENYMVERNMTFARNVAGCYTVVDPDKRHHVFEDLFERKVHRFIESGFWLDEILAYAIRYGFIARRTRSKEKTINRKLLRQGWERCFGDTRLLVFAYAISPPDFLSFLLSPRGISWATRVLETKWESIMKEVDERPVPEHARRALRSIKNEKTG
jgi:hypothetical protein